MIARKSASCVADCPVILNILAVKTKKFAKIQIFKLTEKTIRIRRREIEGISRSEFLRKSLCERLSDYAEAQTGYRHCAQPGFASAVRRETEAIE